MPSGGTSCVSPEEVCCDSLIPGQDVVLNAAEECCTCLLLMPCEAVHCAKDSAYASLLGLCNSPLPVSQLLRVLPAPATSPIRSLSDMVFSGWRLLLTCDTSLQNCHNQGPSPQCDVGPQWVTSD